MEYCNIHTYLNCTFQCHELVEIHKVVDRDQQQVNTFKENILEKNKLLKILLYSSTLSLVGFLSCLKEGEGRGKEGDGLGKEEVRGWRDMNEDIDENFVRHFLSRRKLSCEQVITKNPSFVFFYLCIIIHSHKLENICTHGTLG